MGSFESRPKIQCFNAYNTKFTKSKSHYFIPVNKCASNNAQYATWICEYPKGCYTCLCNQCFWDYQYNKHNPNINFDELGVAPTKTDNLELEKIEYDVRGKMPIVEDMRDMKTIKKGTYPYKMDAPVWTEYYNGVFIKED